MLKTVLFIGGTVAFSSFLTGCASIVSGTSQVVTVETKYKNEAVSGVNCRLENGKGIFFVTTPGTIEIHKAYADLLVTCDKKNLPEGLARVKSSTKAIAFGNIILGGVIGAGVDAGTGAAYDYPPLISISMGEDIRIPLLDVTPSGAPADQTTPTPVSLNAAAPVNK